MAVTVDQIAAHMGVATPSADSPTARQWTAWIEHAGFLVDQRADRMGVVVDEAVKDRVVTLAVVEMARNPQAVSQVDVAVDDGRVSRRFSSSTGQVSILDEWWVWLGLAGVSAAFSTRPGFEPDGPVP